MNFPSAPILFKDDAAVFVLCPYCQAVHKHANGIGNASIESPCGPYTYGSQFDFKAALTGLKMRERDLKRKRAARLKEKPRQE